MTENQARVKAAEQAAEFDQHARDLKRLFDNAAMRQAIATYKDDIIFGIVNLTPNECAIPEAERVELEREYCRILRTLSHIESDAAHKIAAMEARQHGSNTGEGV